MRCEGPIETIRCRIVSYLQHLQTRAGIVRLGPGVWVLALVGYLRKPIVQQQDLEQVRVGWRAPRHRLPWHVLLL